MLDFAEPRSLSRLLWIAAACGALAIHAGGVALAVAALRPESTIDLGAPAIEIGVELTAPRAPPSELPVGPDAVAAAPSPAIVEQKAVVEHNDVPKALPTETDDPDRVVSANATKKASEEDPKVATAEANPSAESAAAEETVAPTVRNAVEAPQSTAPSLGTGESARRQRVTWQKELAAHLNKYKRYPSDRAMQSAEVVISFVLDRGGHVVSARVAKGSGDASFDAAALDMLRRSDPVPPPPPLVADEGLTFSLPVKFHLKGAEVSEGVDQSRR